MTGRLSEGTDAYRAAGCAGNDPAEAAEAVTTPFALALQRSLARAGWLLGQSLAGEPVRDCASPSCRWADRRHVWAPDCGPAAKDDTRYGRGEGRQT